jgi:signal transduction histidine kinase
MLLILFAVAIISFLSNLLLNYEFEKYMTNSQRAHANDIISNFSNQYNGLTQEWNLEFIHGIGMNALLNGYIIRVYDRHGSIVWDAENHDVGRCTQIMAEITERMAKQRPNLDGKFSTYEYELTMSGHTVGLATVSYYGPYFLSESDFYFIETLNLILTIVGIISLALSILISGIIARRLTRPIQKTAYIAREISGGNYSIRFEGNTKSEELDDLAESINFLASDLDEQKNLRKRLTTDIAHELRTPITTLSSHLEAMIEGVWEPNMDRLKSCYEETERLSALVADLERLSQTESGQLSLHLCDVDLLDLVQSCCVSFDIECKKKDISLQIVGEATVIIGDRDRLSQVIANLVSNAIKYTLTNGNIWIFIRRFESQVELIVEDDGIGIPEPELTLIFERFYRTDMSRNRKTGGSGIGLTIVKSIILAHGGTVVAQCRENGGSRFLITMPI